MKNFLRALLLGASLPALSAAAGGLTFGGGVNSSFTDSDGEGVEYSNRLGFNVGVGYEVEATPYFSYMPEINLETRGETGRMGSGFEFPASIEGRMKLLYLQMPVFLMAKAPVGKATVNVFAGPSLGVLLSGKRVFAANGDTETRNVKDDMQPADFGIEAGAGVEFPVGTVHAFVRPSYYHGFVDVNDTEGEPGFSLRNFKLKAGFKVSL